MHVSGRNGCHQLHESCRASQAAQHCMARGGAGCIDESVDQKSAKKLTAAHIPCQKVLNSAFRLNGHRSDQGNQGDKDRRDLQLIGGMFVRCIHHHRKQEWQKRRSMSTRHAVLAGGAQDFGSVRRPIFSAKSRGILESESSLQ